MPLRLIRQDITLLHVDAIVNAANESLCAGGGVCGAIFSRAGHAQLQAACDEIGHVDTGSAVVTPGFALPARHIIHTAGPVWHGGSHGERELLESCYRSSLELAASLGDTSIAFPLISSGIYGYPPAEALAVAVGAIRAFLEEQPDFEVTLCLFDRRATTLTQGLFGQIEQFVDDTYVEDSPFMSVERRRQEAELFNLGYNTVAAAQAAAQAPARPTSAEDAHAAPETMPQGVQASPGLPHLFPHLGRKRKRRKEEASRPTAAPEAGSGAALSAQPLTGPAMAEPEDSLERMLSHLDAPFSEMLLAMIDERGLTDSQVYARANLSRQYFSKLRSGSLNPSKRVVLSLAVALELPIDQTRLLLERAGHALTHASKFDIIVEWFIRAGRYDVFEINEALFAFDQPLLGAS